MKLDVSDVFILSNVGKLGKKDKHFVFSEPDGKEQVLFPFKIKQLIVMGKVSISGDAIRLLSRYKIPVAFISSNGYFNCRLVYSNNKNVVLRQKQYAMLENEKEFLKVAKEIVKGKIWNELFFIKKIKRKNNFTQDEQSNIGLIIEKIDSVFKNIDDVESVESLRGYEGIVAKQYFSALKYNIKPEWAEFSGRSKNPPKSNVNAVLSFLYTVLIIRVETALEIQGLDTMLGSLHSVNYGKAALAFDLAEEFRTPIVDTLCCYLFNLNILNEDDFCVKDFSTEDSDYPLEADKNDKKKQAGVLLSDEGLRKVIEAFQEKLQKTVFERTKKSENATEKLTYEKLILRQVLAYKNMLEGKTKTYKPFVLK